MIEFIFAVCIAVDGDTLRCRMNASQRRTIERIAPRSARRRWRGRTPYSLKIRLNAINAPERCEPGYRRAKQFMASWIKRQTVVCRGSGREWTYSRIVLTCAIRRARNREIDLGALMVKSGLAVACRQFGGQRYDPNARRCTFVRCRRRR